MKNSMVSNCPRCQIVLVSNCRRTPRLTRSKIWPGKVFTGPKLFRPKAYLDYDSSFLTYDSLEGEVRHSSVWGSWSRNVDGVGGQLAIMSAPGVGYRLTQSRFDICASSVKYFMDRHICPGAKCCPLLKNYDKLKTVSEMHRGHFQWLK